MLQWIATTGMLKVLSDTSIRPTLAHYEYIDQAQAEKFTRAIGSHNSRPVQPLNARVVIE